MAISRPESRRLLPDGTPLHNRLLAALPAADYARIQKHLQMNTAVAGRTLQEHGSPVTDVYFPNGGVFSVQDPSGAYPETTGATETADRIYIHGLHAPTIGWAPR